LAFVRRHRLQVWAAPADAAQNWNLLTISWATERG
jgi:hypothetical protein